MAEEDIGPGTAWCAACGAAPGVVCRPDGHTRVKPPLTDHELIQRLRRCVTAGIFGIPAEAVEGIQADITELAKRLEARDG